MRPINKGDKPNTRVGQYREYYKLLVSQIGNYCSYCERPLPDSELNVEHIRPKSTNKEYELCWDNLLLSCFTCNTRKDHCESAIKDVNDLNYDEYAFPHIYDTYHLIDYPSPTYMPEFSANGDRKYQSQVEKLLHLIQLDNADNMTEAQLLDENEISKFRIFAGQEAAELKKDLGKVYNEEKLEATKKKIKREIEKLGFWSIWMKAFEDVAPIKAYLLSLIPGTEVEYFDDSEEIRQTCEHKHKYNDIIGTLASRLYYINQKGSIPHNEEWNNSIETAINKRLPEMTDEEQKHIQKYLDEIKSKQ